MTKMSFDSIGFSNALQKAGLSKEQADLIARGQEEQLEKMIRIRDLATKKDLADMKMELLKWIFGMLVAFAAVLITVLRQG